MSRIAASSGRAASASSLSVSAPSTCNSSSGSSPPPPYSDYSEPTFLDRFGFYLALRLLGTETVRRRLESKIQSAPSSSSSTPSQQSNPLCLYWRSPLLTSPNDLLAVGNDRAESDPSSRVAFVDVTFDFIPAAAADNADAAAAATNANAAVPTEQPKPHVAIHFGSLVRQWQPLTLATDGKIDRSRRGLGATYVQCDKPLNMSDLRRHGEDIGVEVDEMEGRVTAELIGGALLGGGSAGSCSGSRVGSSEGSAGRLRARVSAGSTEGDVIAVTLVLSYPELHEEGDFVIGRRACTSAAAGQEDGNDNDGHIGESALRMFLASLDGAAAGLAHRSSEGGGISTDDGRSADEIEGTRSSTDQDEKAQAAADKIFREWWKAAHERQQLQQSTKPKRLVGSSELDLAGSSGSSNPAPGGNGALSFIQNGTHRPTANIETDSTSTDQNLEDKQPLLPQKSRAGGGNHDVISIDDDDDGDGHDEERKRSSAAAAPCEEGIDRHTCALEANNGGGPSTNLDTSAKPPSSDQPPNVTAAAAAAAAPPSSTAETAMAPPPPPPLSPPPPSAQPADSSEAAPSSRRSNKRPIHGHVLVRGAGAGCGGRGGGRKKKKKRGKVTIGKMS